MILAYILDARSEMIVSIPSQQLALRPCLAYVAAGLLPVVVGSYVVV